MNKRAKRAVKEKIEEIFQLFLSFFIASFFFFINQLEK
jgi:hypothetical protein